MHTMSGDEFREAMDSYQGICAACGELRDEVEPDAEGYKCEDCGEMKVMGVEQALLCGRIHVEEDED